MAKKPQIPLKDVMAAVDKKDRGFYNRLTDEQKKAFSAWMMMRYCSSVQGRDAANYIYLTNELVNFQFMEVSKHLPKETNRRNQWDSFRKSMAIP